MDLAYPLIESVEIDGTEYKLDLSFDNVLRLFDLLQDDELTYITKVETGLIMLIGTDLDYPIEKKAEIFKQLFESTVGKDIESNIPVDIEGNPMPMPKKERHYCFKQDAKYIYASFLQCYNIDLYQMHGKLHWDTFKALLEGLSEDTVFKRIVDIRTCDLPSGKGTSKQREHMIKLKKLYALKD